MADAVVESIAKNIVTTLHNKNVTYNSTSHTTTCERQKSMQVAGGRYPYIVVGGPWADPQTYLADQVELDVNFSIEIFEETISDEEITDKAVTEVLGNLHSDIIKLLMADITRGGYAVDTTHGAYGYYFAMDGDSPIHVTYIDISVKTFTALSDPTTLRI